MRRNHHLGLGLAIASSLLTSCNDSNRSTPYALSGSVFAGAVSGADVRAFRVDRNTGRTTLVAEVQTDSSGAFTLDLRQPGPFLVVASGGSYTDPASATSLDLGDPQDVDSIYGDRTTGLEALIGFSETGDLPDEVRLHALSTIACRRSLALSSSEPDEFNESSVLQLSQVIANEFGLGSTDVRSVDPIDPTVSANASTIQSSLEDARVRTGMLIAALSQCAADLGITDPREVLEVLASDFEDGIMNGQNGTEVLLLNANPVSTGIGDFGLARCLEQFLGSPRNVSGTMASDLSTFLELVATQEPNTTGVNRAPAFVVIESQVIHSLAPMRPLSTRVLVTEPGEVLSATVTSDDLSIADVNWVAINNGELSFDLIPVAVGETELVITVRDDGGTLNGGRDTVIDRVRVHVTAAPVGLWGQSNWGEAVWGN